MTNNPPSENLPTIHDGIIDPPHDVEVLSAAEFKLAFRNHPAGVAVVTADAGNGPVAMTVSSVFSVSAEPPLLVFSASAMSSATATITEASTVVIHLLGADQLNLALLGAKSGANRFPDDIAWEKLPTGETVYSEAHAWIRGRTVNKLTAGNSTVFLIEALEAKTPPEGSSELDASSAHPLVYHNRTWHKLDSSSKIDA
jgi:flavin reductase (DIM6/NTAB) family NADH-FMN oxidoreductase RutF